MNYTQNLRLPQWEGSDRIHHDDFNEAFGKIDAAIPHIVYGSYVGTGSFGADNPNTLTFNFAPQIVFVWSDSPSGYNGLGAWNGDYVLFRPWSKAYGRSSNSDYYQTVTWGNSSVSWYANSKGSAQQQANAAGQTYYYAAIG